MVIFITIKKGLVLASRIVIRSANLEKKMAVVDYASKSRENSS